MALPQSSVRSSRFPQTSSNTVAYWLLGSAASVFGIVVFGGLTRLTESGYVSVPGPANIESAMLTNTYRLSITEWKPVTGSLPPMSEADWAAEFFKYQSSPEFHLLNSRMTLEEFKSIYWMEWIHRLWGRAIGLTFVLPAVYFVARRRISKQMAWRVLGIAGLIGFQGFLGWWMVKSGLKDDLFAPGSHPRVSQYRLTAHLGAAFVVYVSMLWNGLSILRTNRLLRIPPHIAKLELIRLSNPRLRAFKVTTALLCTLVFTTAMSGALVAGLDAGLIYNDFPWMGLGLTPPKSELFDTFYSHVPADSTGQHPDLIWRNMFENPSLVQLDHRILATTTFTAIVAMFAWTRVPGKLTHLPVPARKAMHGVLGFACLQVTLGISTLLYLVPTTLASAHQAGSLLLLSYCILLGSRIWFPRHASRLFEQKLQTPAVRKTFYDALYKRYARHPSDANVPVTPPLRTPLDRKTALQLSATIASMRAVGLVSAADAKTINALLKVAPQPASAASDSVAKELLEPVPFDPDMELQLLLVRERRRRAREKEGEMGRQIEEVVDGGGEEVEEHEEELVEVEVEEQEGKMKEGRL